MSSDNRQRGEDGRFAAQPPQDDPTTDGRATTAADASADTRTGEKAPAPSTPASDPYEAAAIEVTGTRPAPHSDSVVSERQPQRPDPTASQPDSANAGPAQSPPPSPSTTAAADPTPEQKAATASAEAAKAFGDMSAKTHALLKSVPGGLPTTDEWAAMDVTERVEHVARVTDFRNNEKRKYNQRQQGATPAQPAPPTDPSELGPPQPQGARVSGVPQQTLSTDAQQELDALVAEFGEDSPIVKVAQRNVRLEAQFAQRDEQARAEARQAEDDRLIRTGEDQVFDQLETRYPTLSDPRKRDELRQACRDWYEIRSRREPGVNAVAVIQDVVHRSLFQETQQRQTQRDSDASAKLRAGSFDRGAPVPPRGNARAAKGDPYAEVASHLEQAHKEGLTGDAAVERTVRLAGAAQR